MQNQSENTLQTRGGVDQPGRSPVSQAGGRWFKSTRRFSFLGLLFVSFVLFVGISSAQQECPHASGCVTISREAALKALEDSDARKALEAEVKVKDQAIADFRDLLNQMRIQYAEKAGEVTALKQNAVSDRALIEILVKFARPKKFGIINF